MLKYLYSTCRTLDLPVFAFFFIYIYILFFLSRGLCFLELFPPPLPFLEDTVRGGFVEGEYHIISYCVMVIILGIAGVSGVVGLLD